MESVRIEKLKPNPRNNANIISKLFFGIMADLKQDVFQSSIHNLLNSLIWTFPLIYKGWRKNILKEDLCEPLSTDTSEYLGDQLEMQWNKELQDAKEKNSEPSLYKALSRMFFWNYMKIGIFVFIFEVFIRSSLPFLLGKLISYFSDSGQTSRQNAFMYAGLLVSLNFINTFLFHLSQGARNRLGMRARVACCSLIYRKLLRLSQTSLHQTAAGQIVNILSNDVSRFDSVFQFLIYLLILPTQLIVITYLLWSSVQVSCLAGVISLALQTVPLQGYLGKMISRFRLKIAKLSDQRILLMSEIISGMQVIKMYAWEIPFQKLILALRQREIKAVKHISYIRAFSTAVIVFTERTTLFLAVITYALLGNTIHPDQVFSMAQYFNILQCTMAIYYPQAISCGAETLVTIKRLQKVLLLEETSIKKQKETLKNDGQLILDKVYASWEPDNPTISDISLNIKQGSLCIIIGHVGAGKSSLLQTLLEELLPTQGNLSINGKIAYCSQEPWLFISTIRNNILFGLPYDQSKYNKVIEACALVKDFEQFPDGDMAVVGERGALLSGGQKARINLARAVYRNADIYLFDDPLSAVDTNVSKHLFKECISGYLSNKTRVLVTHQIQFLQYADHIVVLDNGKITMQGTYKNLLDSKLHFTNFLNEVHNELENLENNNPEEKMSVLDEKIVANMNEEELETGALNMKIYIEYFRAGGTFCKRILLLLILIFSQAICNVNDYWLSYWTNKEQIREIIINKQSNEILNTTLDTYNNENDFEEKILPKNTYIYIYLNLVVGVIIMTVLRSVLYYNICVTASKKLHNKMFDVLLHIPMRFFDTNPSGRILNRFSKDVGTVDELLPKIIVDTTQIFIIMIGILAVVSIINPWMLVLVIIVLVILYNARRIYMMTAQDIKRLEGITRSPVYSHVNVTLQGLTTIRSCGMEEKLKIEFDNYQNVHTSSWFINIMINEAFSQWVDLVCILFVACVTFSFVLMEGLNFTGSEVGLALSQSMILVQMVQYGIQKSTEMVTQFTSVERILQYTKINTEKQFDTPKGQEPPNNWPSKGKIEFKNVYLRYVEDSPPTLKNLNVIINPGERIGIVGRTGAGKSSFVATLFRLANIEGKVIIDNVNTDQIGLSQLRTSVSIIPQQPTLFSTSLRKNLDPFDKYSDHNLWYAIEQVELKNIISNLDSEVNEGGSNFSIGQRQLICLARAILQNNKILVMDEATANVDLQTDQLIQTTIREKFADCTVLTVAHRLNTIMDSDKVLVIDAGQMLEFDHPHVLCQNKEGHFYKMVAETGPAMTKQLCEMAQKAYQNTETSTQL